MPDYYLNTFGLETPGEQPIRVFYPIVKIEFEEIKKLLLGQYSNNSLNNLKLSFLTENIKVLGPCVSVREIQLHDSFLSFLWCYCYGLTITLPMGGKEFNELETDKARNLFRYANDIMFKKYRNWPSELPNPENTETHYKDYVAATNGVFRIALLVVLFHEFAHVVLRHLEYINPTIDKRRQMEYEADTFAINEILKIVDVSELTRNIGIISAISSLSFGQDKFDNSSFHPEPEDRLTKCLEHLNYPANNFIWGSASWVFLEWQIYFGLFSKNIDSSSFKNTYYGLINELKEFKSTNSNK